MCDCSRYSAMAKRQSTMLMFSKKMIEQAPDSLHSFWNARQVGLCLLPKSLIFNAIAQKFWAHITPFNFSFICLLGAITKCHYAALLS